MALAPKASLLFYPFKPPGTSPWRKPSLSWSQALSVSWHRLNLCRGCANNVVVSMMTGQPAPWPCPFYTRTAKISISCCSPTPAEARGQTALSALTADERTPPWGKQWVGGSEVVPHWEDCISYRFIHKLPAACCCHVISNGLWLQPCKDGGTFGLCSQLKICPGFCPALQWICWRLLRLNVADGRSVQMHSLERVFSAKREEWCPHGSENFK